MLESLRLQIIAADSTGIIFVSVFLFAVSAASLYAIFRFFHRSRVIDDTPTSKIRSAHQGFVELEGTGRLMKGMPIVSPLSNKQCLWYDYKIEHRTRELDIGPRNSNALSKSNWEIVSSGISDNLFLLADETGICVIDPDGATITPSFSKTWYGSGEHRMIEAASVSGILAVAGVSGKNNYRYTEKRIDVGAELYILGRFKSVGGRREKLDKPGEVRDLIAKWKKTPNFVQRKFDRNGDGEIDMQEWQHVIKAAEQEVENSIGERLVQQEIHTLSKPVDSRRPFIISVEDQHAILKTYRRFSFGSIVLFFLSGISLVWIIGLRIAN